MFSPSPATIPIAEPCKESRFPSLEQWLRWQEGLHFTAIELGLDRCRMVAERMGLLAPAHTVVSIAGTNGKGSSAVMLDLILRNAGYRVGRYTSPHLLRYNERISVNGVDISDALLCTSFQKIDQARRDISLTYFEFGTLAAMDIFAGSNLDVAILEVGLGGRLDAVNVLDADVSLVTTIDVDHELWLGYDRESIGREKAGIYRSGRPAVCGDPNAPASVADTAAALGAKYIQCGTDFRYRKDGDSFAWFYGPRRMLGIPNPCHHHESQVQNAAGVMTVLAELGDRLPVSAEHVSAAMAEFRIPGRFQIIPGEIPVILDVAHNRQAGETLAANLARLGNPGRNHIVVGMLRDKNHHGFYEQIERHCDRLYLATLRDERGTGAAELAESMRAAGSPKTALFDSVADAIDAAKAAAVAGDHIVVTGSFITIAAALKCMNMQI